MNRDELVDAVESLETDEIAAIAHDLPADVVDEVQQGLTDRGAGAVARGDVVSRRIRSAR